MDEYRIINRLVEETDYELQRFFRDCLQNHYELVCVFHIPESESKNECLRYIFRLKPNDHTH